jgi:hypothetical protein
MTALAPRFECKYCVPAAEAEAALGVARVFLDIDRAAWPDAVTDGPLPVQRVTSLYLDSPARTFYGWHVARRPSRFKLRLRRYSAGQQGVTWAEVKHKVNGRVLKTRGLLPVGAVPLVEAGRPSEVTRSSEPDPALDDFLSRQRAFGASAQVVIRCDRRGVRGTGSDRAVGVTVDSVLGVRRGPHASLLDESATDWLALPLGQPCVGAEPTSIVELKHGGHPPVWMRRLMTRLAPWQCSYSKYIAATQVVARLEGGRR